MSHARILFHEIMPNIVAPLLVEAAVAFSYAILLESALSFLGLGAQPPEPTWGTTCSTPGAASWRSRPCSASRRAWRSFLTVLGFNFIGDGLRDALDPHMKD